jgi:uncharacterized protein YbaP (TraB family)
VASLLWVFIGLAAGPANLARAAPCPPGPPAALPATAATAPGKDRGFLWRITRDGHSSWLFGTLHVGKPAWAQFGPQVSAALRASDVLALEIDPNDPALLAALSDTGPPLDLTPALQARLNAAYAQACLAPELLAALNPVLQATTLTVLDARWLGMDANYAQEQLLLARMKTLGHPVASLETAEQQKQALVPDDPAAARALVDQSLTELEDGSGRRVLARLAQTWEAGDLALLADYPRWCECDNSEEDRNSMRHLIDDRNPGLANGIAALHRQGLHVFAAVGALHMTGPKALPLLLRQQGFRVERIEFKH